MKQAQQPELTCSQRTHQFFFPHDMAPINSRGMYLQPTSYNIYRLATAIFSLGMQTSLMLYGPAVENFTYLTYWGFTASTFYFMLAAIDNIVVRVYGKQVACWKVPHFIFPDVLCLSLMINSVFWLVFFPALVQSRAIKWIDILQAIGAHFLPLLLLLADYANNLVCFWNIKRAGTTLAIMGCYLILNATYTIEVDIIYEALTYDDWKSYVLIVACVAGVFFWHALLWLYSAKLKQPLVKSLLGIPPSSKLQRKDEKTGTDELTPDLIAGRSKTQSQVGINQVLQSGGAVIYEEANKQKSLQLYEQSIDPRC